MLNNGSSLSFVDVVLKLPLTFQTEFSSCLKDARAYLSPVLSVEEVLDHGKLSKNGEHLKHSGLLEGSLLSCHGKVESFDLKQTLHLSEVPYVAAKGSIFLVLKDLNDSQSVSVQTSNCFFSHFTMTLIDYGSCVDSDSCVIIYRLWFPVILINTVFLSGLD